jgi:hypothetical protein
MDAGESLLNLVNTFDEEVYMSGPITAWISGEFVFTCLFSCIETFPLDFTHRCLSAPKSGGGTDLKAARHDDGPMLHHVTLNLPALTSLLREWAKSTLARRSWKDALVAAASVSIFLCSGTHRGIDTLGMEFVVPRFAIYQVICEHLETIHRIAHASECFRRMVDELALEIKGKEAQWVLGE